MKNPKLLVLLAFSALLTIASIIVCGIATDGVLIPGNFLEAKFAIVFNSNSEGGASSPMTINVYKVDPNTGSLAMVPGSPFATGVTGGCCEPGGRVIIDADPSSQFVYVPLLGLNGVQVFSIDQSSGALTAVSGSPFATGGSVAYSAKVTPDGRFLYVGNTSSDDITVFSVGANGSLTKVGSNVAMVNGDSPNIMTIDPQGRFLYVSHLCCSSGTVDGFAINSGTGALTPIAGSPFTVCPSRECRGGVVDPSGTFLIMAEPWLFPIANIQVQKIDQSSGALTSVGTTPSGSRGDSHPNLVTANGQTYMLVNNIYNADVSVFTFNTSTGALSAISGSPFKVNANWLWLHDMTLDPTGKFAYAVDFGVDCCANGPSTITGVTLDSSGNPVQIPGSPFSNGNAAPTQIIITH